MGERLTKVEKIIKDYEKSRKMIENKYSDKDLKEKIAEIDKKLKPSELHIQRLEDELKEIPATEKDLIAEYKKKIEEERNPKLEGEEGFDENAHYDKERRNNLDEKQKLLEELNNRQKNKDREKTKKNELLDLETKQRATLTQEKMSIDNEIEKVELNMKMTLMDIQDFKYEYEEKDGVRIPKNGAEYKELNDKYADMQDKLKDLKDAKNMCERKLEEFKQKDNENAEKISKAWYSLKEDERKLNSNSKGNTNKIKYIEIVEKDEKVYYKDEMGNTKEISTDISKKELFKDLKISDVCKELTDSKISSLLLKRKINPNIVSVLREHPEQLKEYIISLKEKKDLPFELVHNLQDISLWKKFRLNKFAKIEEKLGAKVLGKVFDKNKTLAQEKGKKLIAGVKDKTIEGVGIVKDNAAKAKDIAKSFVPKINNKDSHIEAKANEAVKETQESMAKEVNEMSSDKGTEK